jgi:hypothetical protein
LAASLKPFSHAGWNSGGMLLPISAFSNSNLGLEEEASPSLDSGSM